MIQFLMILFVSVGVGLRPVRAETEVVQQRARAGAGGRVLRRRARGAGRAVPAALSDPLPGVPEALPGQHRHHVTLHVRGRHHPRPGRQLGQHDRQRSRGVRQPHQVPLRLCLAGKSNKKTTLFPHYFNLNILKSNFNSSDLCITLTLARITNKKLLFFRHLWSIKHVLPLMIPFKFSTNSMKKEPNRRHIIK